MEKFITVGLIGSLVTSVIQANISTFTERIKYKQELRKLVFQRKTEVVERAMSWYQETFDMYSMLQMALKEYDNNCNPLTVEKIRVACIKSNKLFHETESRLNAIYLLLRFF